MPAAQLDPTVILNAAVPLAAVIVGDVQKPLAIVVVGGMMLAPIVILVTLPALIVMFSRRRAPQNYAEPANAPAE